MIFIVETCSGEDNGKGSLLNKTVVILIAGSQRPPLQKTNAAGAPYRTHADRHLAGCRIAREILCSAGLCRERS
ncbi:MAG TPA: hypothetical protein GX519_04825 [Thermoanaerobacterales bacterium]|nr:hypothetical protein [Thermoanaerobacterales bacterium]